MGVLMNRENWLKNIEGAVFDLDGTLLDSSWVWEKVDEKFLGDRGSSLYNRTIWLKRRQR